MPSNAELWVSRSFRTLLAPLSVGAKIRDSAKSRKLLCGLEFFIPSVLRELYPEWEYESLDGVYPITAQKTADLEAEIFGICIIISDQTLTPFHVRLQISQAADEVSWMECRLGEKGDEGWKRPPYKALPKMLHDMEGRAEVIDWVYQVTFGERRK